MALTCTNCLLPFESKISTAKYCSSNCNHNHKNRINRALRDELYNKSCLLCGASFRAQRIITRFCSSKCNNKFLYDNRSIEQIKTRNLRVLLRTKKDVNQKLKSLLRTRIRKVMKHNYKVGSAVKDLGCTTEELRKYLESKWQPGMSWDNRGLFGWHIDHIIPLCKFDLSDPEQFKKACHYTNLQPLWWQDNLKKGDK